jgi:4-amino-4-deoxy-L-arabinose transferase
MATTTEAPSSTAPAAAATPWWQPEWWRHGARRRRGAAAGIAAVLCLAFAFQGTRGLWEPDEGRYTDVAMEMLRTGDLLDPVLNHETPHFTKPPATYWAIAGSVALLGRHEWAVRLPYALAFAATALLLLWMGRSLVPRRPWLAPLAYVVMLLPFVAANVVSTDTFLAFATTLAMACFVAGRWGAGGARTRWGDAAHSRAWFVAMWAAFGFAFFVKGPPSLLPLLAVLVFTAVDGGAAALRRVLPPLGILAFLLLAGWWFVLVIVQRPEMFGYFVGGEVVGRILSSRFHRNPAWYGGFEVYVPVLLVGTLPWTWLLARAAVRRLRRPWRLRERPQALFLALWVLLPLLVFFVVRSRLPLYLLPLMAPLALVAARRLSAGPPPSRRLLAALALWVVFLLVLKGGAGHLPERHKDSRALAAAVVEAGFSRDIYSEVVFVDTWARYGISLYLDAEVEEVTLAPWPIEPGELVPRETLAAEVREPGEQRFVVCETQELDLVEAHLRSLGLEPRRLADWHELTFLDPEGRLASLPAPD